jgi:hypothetical protein
MQLETVNGAPQAVRALTVTSSSVENVALWWKTPAHSGGCSDLQYQLQLTSAPAWAQAPAGAATKTPKTADGPEAVDPDSLCWANVQVRIKHPANRVLLAGIQFLIGLCGGSILLSGAAKHHNITTPFAGRRNSCAL